jgi:hypothetical protein
MRKRSLLENTREKRSNRRDRKENESRTRESRRVLHTDIRETRLTVQGGYFSLLSVENTSAKREEDHDHHRLLLQESSIPSSITTTKAPANITYTQNSILS